MIKNYTGYIDCKSGYVTFGADSLHLLVLGRKRGEYFKDKLQGLHSKGGKLDNRKRTLRLGTASENVSMIVCKTARSTSKYTGVHYNKGGKRINRWISTFSCVKQKVILGAFNTEIAASNVYGKVNRNRAEIEQKLKQITDKEEKIKLVKSYI